MYARVSCHQTMGVDPRVDEWVGDFINNGPGVFCVRSYGAGFRQSVLFVLSGADNGLFCPKLANILGQWRTQPCSLLIMALSEILLSIHRIT